MKRNWLFIALLISGCASHVPPAIIIHPPPTPEPIKILQKLIPHTPSSYFTLEDNSRFTIKEVTDFALFKRYLDGEDIEPILIDRDGFNTHRVFLTCANLFDLKPSNYPNYYDKLVPFAQFLAKHDRYVEFVVFADAAIMMPVLADQLVHWNRILKALKDQSNILLELVNENDQLANHIDTDKFEQPLNFVSSHGSNGSEALSVRPAWVYETFHSNSAFEWQRKAGHNAWEFNNGTDGVPASHVAILSNENTRYPDSDQNLNHYFDAAAGTTFFVAGGAFHCNGCRTSMMFTPDEKIAAQIWLDGQNSIELFCQDGYYSHRIDLENIDGDLRDYSHGPGDTCVLHVRH